MRRYEPTHISQDPKSEGLYLPDPEHIPYLRDLLYDQDTETVSHEGEVVIPL